MPQLEIEFQSSIAPDVGTPVAPFAGDCGLVCTGAFGAVSEHMVVVVVDVVVVVVVVGAVTVSVADPSSPASA